MTATPIRTYAVPEATIEDVTPAVAARWLALNENNRNIRSKVVESYARDMAAGNWCFTGEAVKFDKDGNLLDGQHRLMAVVRSGATVRLLIISDVDASAQAVMDSGARRSAADSLTLGGTRNASLVASTARLGLVIEAGIDHNLQVTHSEIAEYVAHNPDIHEAASATSGLRKFIRLNPAALSYSWMLLGRVDRAAAVTFFDSLANNATNGKGDPRNTLLRRLQSAGENRERLNSFTQVAFVVRAWNAWRAEDELHVLRDRASNGKGGSTRVSIPSPR
jgi:hypothetical protein